MRTLEVLFFKARVNEDLSFDDSARLDWKARIRKGNKTWMIGPAGIRAVLRNVSAFIANEATHVNFELLKQFLNEDEAIKTTWPVPTVDTIRELYDPVLSSADNRNLGILLNYIDNLEAQITDLKAQK